MLLLNLKTQSRYLFLVCLLVGFSQFTLNAQCSGGIVPNSCNALGECGPNQIINPSFEDGGVNGWLYSGCGAPNQGDPFLAPCGFIIRDGWSTFNAGVIRDNTDPFDPCGADTPSAFTGNNFLKMWEGGGTFLANEIEANGGPVNWPDVTPGETYCASVRMMSPSEFVGGCEQDHLSGDIYAVLRVEFWLADNTICEIIETPRFTESYANSGWYTMSTQGIAPPGAVRANVIMLMIGGGGGAVYFDDVYFGVKEKDGTIPQLVCNNHINVSANSNCEIDINVQALLEGEGSDLSGFTFDVLDELGNPIDLSNVSDYIGTHTTAFTYVVSHLCSSATCSGTITLEDKSDPTINCVDCVDPVNFSPECMLNCAELELFTEINRETGQIGYDENLLDALIPGDPADFIRTYIGDNCGGQATAYYTDHIGSGDCETGRVLTRNWVVQYTNQDGSKGTLTCEKYYFFSSLGVYNYDTGTEITDANGIPVSDASVVFIGTIPIVSPGTAREDTIIMPVPVVEIPTCNVGTSPAEVMAFFDNLATIDRDTDDDNIDPDEFDIDCVIESNEGVYFAYPHYFIRGINPAGPHPQPITGEKCNVIVDYWDTPIDACAIGCNGNSKTLRTWTIFDWCESNYFEYDQVIKVVDDIGPSYDLNDFTVSVDPWSCTATVDLPHPEHFVDNCDTELDYHIGQVEGALIVTGNQVDGYVLQGAPIGTTDIQYVAEDCCGNQSKQVLTVTVVDETAPVPVTKKNLVIELTASAPVDAQDLERGTAKLLAVDVDNGSYDSCTDVIVDIRRSPVCDSLDAEWGEFVHFCCADLNGSESTTIKVEMRVRDWNGNENIIWTDVLLEDKVAGSIQCPADMVLRCDQDIWNFDITGGIPRAFNSCMEIDLPVDTLEVFEDTEPRNKPANQGLVPGYIGVAVPAYDPSCGFGAWRRTFESCTQWFVVEPIGEVFDPSTIVWPADVSVDCDGYETGEPTWLEATCELVGHTLETDTFSFEADACVKIINNWTVINWCAYNPNDPDKNNFVDERDFDGDGINNLLDNDDDGNGQIDGVPYDSDGDGILDSVDPDLFDPAVEDSGTVEGRFEHTQVIKIIDTVKPTVTSEDNLCFNVTEECVSKGVVLSAVGTDEGDCASEWISWEVTIDYNDDWNIDCVFSSNVPAVINGEPNEKYLPKTGSGEAVTIVLEDGLAASKNTHRADWLVNDGCGNSNSLTTYFTIEDKKAPTPYCLNLSTAVMSNGEVELWAIDFNQDAFDNCTDKESLLFTFTDVAPPPRCDAEYDSNADLLWYTGAFWYFDSEEIDADGDNDCDVVGFGEYKKQGDYGGEVHIWQPAFRSSGKIFTADEVDANGFLQIPIYVWDECANIDFCLVNVRITDNGGGAGIVAGEVRTENNDMVEDVMTELMSASPDYPKYNMTEEDGIYAFEDNALTQDYLVTGTRDDFYTNGVNTADLIKIQRHILGLESLDSPYKMIAADINNDNRINGQDLVELRKLVLGVYLELPQNDSWKILAADQTLTITNPWIYDEEITIADMSDNMMDEDFIGVKIGDVTGDVIANSFQSDVTTGNTIQMNYEDVFVQAGEQVELAVNTEAELYGYQFTMNMSGVELVNVAGLNIQESNIAVFDNVMTMSYNSDEAISGEVMTITVKATESGNVSDLMGMTSGRTKAEAYIGKDLEAVKLTLNNESGSVFSLGQNEPNPFSEITTIGYSLPSASAVTMTLYDVTGKILQVIRANGEKGENTMKVSKDNLTAGVVYYKLESGEHTATKHMIVIE